MTKVDGKRAYHQIDQNSRNSVIPGSPSGISGSLKSQAIGVPAGSGSTNVTDTVSPLGIHARHVPAGTSGRVRIAESSGERGQSK